MDTDHDSSIKTFDVNATIEVDSAATFQLSSILTTQLERTEKVKQIETNATVEQIRTNVTVEQIETNATVETDATVEIETNGRVDELRTFHRNDSFKKAVNAEEEGEEETEEDKKSVRFYFYLFLH